jgi:hypothetical protein
MFHFAASNKMEMAFQTSGGKYSAMANGADTTIAPVALQAFWALIVAALLPLAALPCSSYRPLSVPPM